MPEYNHNLPLAAYRAALLAEANEPNITRAHKAAIVAELEAIGPRTADEDRAAVEAATLGPVTIGRAPSVDVVQVAAQPTTDAAQDPTDSSVAQDVPPTPVPVSGPSTIDTVGTDPEDDGR